MSEIYDVAVIGSGPGGYVAAIRAAQLGLKTACIEKEKKLGGTCLNVGCIPSKSLLQSSELYAKIVCGAKEHGIKASASIDFAEMMKRKNQVVAGFNRGIQALFKKNQIVSITGKATFLSETTLSVDGQKLRAKNFILATGSEPMSLSFLPFDEKVVLSSTGALALEKIPKKMVVIGAGIIGVELGSVYSRLGTKVIFVEFLDQICAGLDESLSSGLQPILTNQGLEFELSTKVIGANVDEKGVRLKIEKKDGGLSEISGEVVLVSIGRRPYTKGLGLEAIGIKTDQKGLIPVNENFRTSHPHIYAIGDLIEGPMLAHKASEEGYAVSEMISGASPHIDYIAIPSVIYTHPEVASVGLSEKEAKTMQIPYQVAQFPLKANSRAHCSGEEEGFVKIVTCKQTDTILGVHILSPHAGELIGEATLAIEKKMGANELGNICHAHPTFSEALKEAALAVGKKAIHI